MKKILSLFVLALFLVSLVPIAIADENEDSSGTNMEVREETKIDDDKTETRTEIIAANGEKIRLRTEVEDKDGVTKAEVRSRLEARNATSITKEEIRARFEDRREELKEKLRIMDPEKLRRLEALDNVAIDKIAGLSKDEVEKLAALSRAKQAELAGLDKVRIEERLREIRIKTIRTADDLKERVLTRQKIELSREKFENARERYEEAKEKYQDARERYLAAKDSGDEEAALGHAKEVLLKSADSIIGHLEKIKAKIDENEQISDENAANLIARIDSQISEINTIKEKIAAAETKDQIKEAAKELRNKWKDTEQKARAFAERVVTARVEGVVNQAEVLEKKLDAALAKMEERGIEVDVDAEVAAFSALVQSAKDSFNQAQEKLKQAIDATDRETQKDLVADAKSMLEDSRELLKDAHDKLKDIVEKLREAGQELEIDDDDTVEVEEDEDESEDEEETKDDEELEDEE
ncbi:hypothetical protein HYU09_02860 [Candidatus Woesearchaeota archaeon]|nr:hypothetical protein [Candidatus Woesearchaeota archaeon]